MANKTIYPFGTDGQLPSSIGVINDLTTGGADKALSAEQGLVLGNMLGVVDIKTKDDADKIVRTATSGTITTDDNPNGTRLRICFYVKAGAHVNIQTTWEQGFYAGVWSDLLSAVKSFSKDALQVITPSSYTTDTKNATISNDGVFCVSMKPATDVAISDEVKAQMLASITIRLSEMTEASIKENVESLSAIVGDLADKVDYLNIPLPNFVVGTASISGNASVTTSNTPRVVIKDCIAMPYGGCKLYAKVPDGFLMGFRFFNGYNNTDAAYGGSWFVNGSSVTPDIKYSHFMCYLAHTIDGSTADNDYTFDVDSINSFLANGEIAVQYESESGDVVKRMLASSQQIKSTMVRYSSAKTYNIQGAMPTFVHCSDVHGDVVRWRNVVELAVRIKANAVINTGDSVAYHIENGEAFLPTVVADLMADVPIISAVGNHDTNGGSTFRANLNTNLYNNIIKPFEESAGYTLPSSSDYEDAPTYYYRDFATQKVRVITLNLYDKGQPDWNSNVLSQKQINWLIATLASTPANYGVLLDYHRSCGGVVKDDNYSKFWQVSSTSGYAPSTWALAGITGNPILAIIDAFIAKTTLSSSFTQSVAGSTTQTITISADFTSLNSGVEFIAHLFGHHHRDTIGYYNSTQKQLVLCVCQSTAAYSSVYTSWANPSDLPRFGGGKEQDAVNVYTIDRNAKTVRVAKFGSTLSSETLEPRDFMVIPYAD